MCGSILLILHLHRHNGTWEVPFIPLLGFLRGREVRRQRRVEGVREQHELELDLHGRREAALEPSNGNGVNQSARESSVKRSNQTDLFLEFHADGIGLFKEDGISPQLVTERGELVAPPLTEAPHGQLPLRLCPLCCG